MTAPRNAAVLVVEDQEELAYPLVRTMERDGYVVTWVGTGQDALDHLATIPCDLVMLDLGLPDMDGLDVCRRARTAGFEGVIVIVSARRGALDRTLGLAHGADDYVPKPFPLAELKSRVRALLARPKPDDA